MLVRSSELFVRAAFMDGAEIEDVVQTYAEQLFGSSIIYLPQNPHHDGRREGHRP